MKTGVDLVLTPAELTSLTGTVQAKRQAAWLTEREWVFEQASRRGDSPKVDRTYYLLRMSGAELPNTARTKPRLDCFGGK